MHDHPMTESAERAAKAIVEKLRAHGFQALYAGGCVRDHLLGLTPHDYDVATSARPEEVQALFPRTVPIGAQFGVILVLEEGAEIQVATFRGDGAYHDGRHPESVHFTDAEGDAKRRDFTINGLFYDPMEEKLLDFVGGQEDLQSGIIRAIGIPSERFAEDKLRLLRAIRFATTLGFSLDLATEKALQEGASEIHAVSAERIREELVKILISPHRLRGFDLLNESGLLREILPEIEALKGCDQPPEFHPEGDVFIHTRLMLSLLAPQASLSLVLAILLHDIGKPATRLVDETGRIRFNGHEGVSSKMALQLLQRLRFSNELIEAVIPAVLLHMSFKDVPKMRIATLKRMMARSTFDEELELHRIDCLASHGMLDNHALLLAKREEFSHEPLIPAPLITGHDLIAMGWKPGKQFSKVLQSLQNRQLEGTLTTREEALAWISCCGSDTLSDLNAQGELVKIALKQDDKKEETKLSSRESLDALWRDSSSLLRNTERMICEFTKMSGAGNDFLMMDNREGSYPLHRDQIARLCDRHRGIGGDGLIVVEGSPELLRMRYYNADGGEAEMCGNGARCFARYAARLLGKNQGTISFSTQAGLITAELLGEQIRLHMSEPHSLQLSHSLTLLGKKREIHFLNTGVPHAALFVSDLDATLVTQEGRALRHHEHFSPAGTNANFIQQLAPSYLAIRTYERGVEEETLACGTGVVAAALIHHLLSGAPSPIQVRVRGGETLEVGFQIQSGHPVEVTLMGSADFVFEGSVALSQ
jgi:poly(A) polymerase